MASLRAVKGQELAARGELSTDGLYWYVPSQTGKNTYRVSVAHETPTCTCADYELSGLRCKHIHAAYAAQRQQTATQERPERPPRSTYRQDWPAYNTAQVNEKAHFQDLLHTLCQQIAEPTYTFGRPRLPLSDMVFAACFKVYSTISARRFMTDMREAHAQGMVSRLPCYNTIFNYFEDAALTPILRTLIERSALPLKAIETRFAVDSTGFSTCRYVRWYDAKYGREMEQHEWVKAHAMCGVTTNIITSVEITEGTAADYVQFKPLVDATARHFNMYEVSADKAYSGRDNLEAVYAHHATPYIPFKSNSRARRLSDRSAGLWDRLYHYYHLHRETFLEHYHRRSLIESTFWMVKAKFGDALRSKSDTAQVNELLCKVLCHNLCVLIQSFYELGIEPEF
jgi:transposase